MKGRFYITFAEIFSNDGTALLIISLAVIYCIYRVVQSICDDIWMERYYNECDRRLERKLRDKG